MSILIVEDDADVIAALKNCIRDEFKTVKILEAYDPTEAVSVFEENKTNIHYLICDYLLPMQNGKIFIDLVKEYSPSIKVCLFTGDGSATKKMVPGADEIFYKEDGLQQIINFLKNK